MSPPAKPPACTTAIPTAPATTIKSRPILLLLLLLISTPLPATQAFSYVQWRTLFSLGNSLMNRVANLRASRGDFSGSERARRMAAKLELGRNLGLGFWGGIWSMSWDYVRNYAWRDMVASSSLREEMFGAISDMNELLRVLNELNRMKLDKDRTSWVLQNYKNVLRISRSIFERLLHMFRQSGPLRELVLTLQREVEDGNLLKDCLELGVGDLKGLIQVVKDISLQYSSASSRDDL